MMMNNNPFINKMDQNQVLQAIQKNNEQIIQMIQQIFYFQMLNNVLFNQILNKNLNDNNIINNNIIFNDMMNQMNNFMNNLNIMNNQNVQNTMINPNNNDNDVGLSDENNVEIVNIVFDVPFEIVGKENGKCIFAPNNISIKELIEAFFKKYGIIDPNKQKDILFIFCGKILNNFKSSTLKEIGFGKLAKIEVTRTNLMDG